MVPSTPTVDVSVADRRPAGSSFRAEWQRLAPAREFATTLLRYRAEHKLNQRELAKKICFYTNLKIEPENPAEEKIPINFAGHIPVGPSGHSFGAFLGFEATQGAFIYGTWTVTGGAG